MRRCELIRRISIAAFLLFCVLPSHTAQAQALTHNVVLIVSDGLRWQEVFTGADPTLLNEKDGGIWESAEALRGKFWSDDPSERRRKLFPFLWDVVTRQGQMYGNRNLGSIAQVSNPYAFSYPGYSEMITGKGDPRIDKNDFGPNPNINVFEWLNHERDLAGKVHVYGTWETFRDIFNQKRSGLPVSAGWTIPPRTGTPDGDKLYAQLIATTTRFDDEDLDNALLQPPLLESIRSTHPRLLFVGYGATDNWAHAGRYDLVLESAHQFDAFVRQLWETMQSMPEYKDQTTFLITTDHGRGSGLVDWKEHGVGQKGSENIWIAIIGPDTDALGERAHIQRITQSQIAATIASLLGKDFRQLDPQAAAPIEDVLPHGSRR
jgi:hypothetical protein